MSDENDIRSRRAQLSPAKRALLEKRLRGEGAGTGQRENQASARVSIVPDPAQRHEPFPLRDMQQAYWIGRSSALELGNVAAHGYLELACEAFDVERFNRAWQRLIQRHDMLRAVVLPDGRQRILENVPAYQIQVADLRGQTPATVRSQLEETRQRMSHQIMNAEHWPLFEICASRLSDQLVRLHTSFDLLIADAWSARLLHRELALVYEAPDAPLPPLDISFREYVLAEARLRASDRGRRALDYWKKRVPSLPLAPDLPLAKNPGSLTHPQFVRHRVEWDSEFSQRLKTRAAKARLTVSAVLLAAFAEVLAVWSRSPHFTITLTLFDRLPLHPQVNEIVGDFTSVDLLAIDSCVEECFEARARRLQQRLWEDLDQSLCGGVQVLREFARVRRDAPRVSMPVVFTSTLNLRSATSQQDAIEAFPLGHVIYGISQTPQVWLDHQVSEMDGRLVCNWDAVEELFPDGLIQEMFDAYCLLVRRLADQPQSWDQTTGLMLPPAQLTRRAAVNATDAPISKQTLHTLFAAQVSQRPGQVAVAAPKRRLTYQELSLRSGQVAHRLRQAGARPNALVAVVMEKGWEQVVAVLGVLQAGAAYVPIDPQLPQERLWYVLKFCQVECVLTQSWLETNLMWPEHLQRLCIDRMDLSEADHRPLASVQGPEDLAFVIFTSGSTGLPKGVMIDHRGAVNTIVDINRRFGVGPNDRVLALSSLSFDLSVYDIFGALAAGATIVIPDASATRDSAHVAELMEREQVTLWNSVPALMQMLVEHLGMRSQRLPGSLRLVLLSGDWIPMRLPDRIKALAQSVQVISLGGATESSIWSVLHPIETVDSEWKSILYGKPIANQRLYVLNEALDPCPDWVAGHLYIGGIGLAKGYWRDEEKTRASFILHPQTGERRYRTGDLASWRPDGNIEFLGREDSQVKVQGYRIELSEIEVALEQHPQVGQAAVIASGDCESQRLVAYVVGNPEGELSSQQLQDFLKKKLPHYMVPSAFLFLDTLPLTYNGKVDRRALPAPERTTLRQGAILVAPRFPREQILADMWADLLGLEQVGVQDNFFELGANSLLATQLISRIWEVFQVELSLNQIFEAPSVAGLAESIENVRWAARGFQATPGGGDDDRETGEISGNR